MQKLFYPTIKDYKKMGLTDTQIDTLISYSNDKYGFFDQQITMYHHSEPNSIFFLDIKDTLYHSRGHGGDSVLGRAGDSLQISMNDILSLGALLDKNKGQVLTIHDYTFSDDDSIKISYTIPKDENEAKYKIGIPKKLQNQNFGGMCFENEKYGVSSGPYKTVFISSDPVDKQKNIILFLLIIYKIYLQGSVRVYTHHLPAAWIDSETVLRLEKLFTQCECDYDTFVKNLPTEFKDTLDSYTKKDLEETMSKITFLSTSNTNKTKVQLMQEFLDKYNLENGLTYDDYNIFACGDDYEQDSPMIKLALKLGGYGCLNKLGFNYFNKTETLRKELFEESNIEFKGNIASYNFFDFYHKTLDWNALQRTWDLALTMQDANDKNKSLILNRFKKTSNYINIERK